MIDFLFEGTVIAILLWIVIAIFWLMVAISPLLAWLAAARCRDCLQELLVIERKRDQRDSNLTKRRRPAEGFERSASRGNHEKTIACPECGEMMSETRVRHEKSCPACGVKFDICG